MKNKTKQKKHLAQCLTHRLMFLACYFWWIKYGKGGNFATVLLRCRKCGERGGWAICCNDALSVVWGWPVSPGGLLVYQNLGLCPGLRNQSMPLNKLSRWVHIHPSLRSAASRNTGSPQLSRSPDSSSRKYKNQPTCSDKQMRSHYALIYLNCY